MKQAEKSTKTKQKIVQAAMTLCENRGIDEVSVNEICHLAGIAVGTFYYYYPSKETIFPQIFSDAAVNLEAMLEREKDETDPVRFLEKFFYSYAVQNQSMGTDGAARVRNDHYVRSVIKSEDGNKIYSLLKERLNVFYEAGKLTPGYSPAHVAQELLICARGLVLEWCVLNGGFDLERQMQIHMKPYIAYYIQKV